MVKPIDTRELKVVPIRPEDITKEIPSEIIRCINLLISKSFDGETATVFTNKIGGYDVIKYSYGDKFVQDLIKLYSEYGWDVKYTVPEKYGMSDGAPSFTFTRK